MPKVQQQPPQKIQVGTWAIDRAGNMYHASPAYDIDGSRLGDGNWITHMAAKRWVDMREFVRAYFTACQIRGLRTVSLRTDFMF